MHRSTAMIFEYDEANKQLFTSLADEDWYKTDIAGSVLDVHGLVMHEYGHAVAYHSDWAGMRSYVAGGGNDPDVVAYQGRAVPLDSSYHIPGDQPNWDRLSGQSGGWTHLFPTRRWMLTKLALLVAENAGWKLNRNLTPFLAPSIVTTSLPQATPGTAYQQTLSAKGGVPFYDWQVTSGSLPAGLSLDRFTGTISGTPTTAGTSTFTVQLRDYDSRSTPVTKSFQLQVGGATTPTNLARSATPTASYTSAWESVAAINDGIDPPSLQRHRQPPLGHLAQHRPAVGRADLAVRADVRSADVYFFDDNDGVRLPASWKLQYWNGTAYVDVPRQRLPHGAQRLQPRHLHRCEHHPPQSRPQQRPRLRRTARSKGIRLRRKIGVVTVLAGLVGALSVPTPGLAARQAAPALDVFDIFYRNVNDHGVRLVDWQGYLANPYIELTVRAPKVAGIAYPLTVDLKAEGTSRLMLNMPSELTATGATKSFTLTGPADREVVRLAIHSKQGPGQDERHKWVMKTTDATGATITQTMPITVQQDEKTALRPTIPIDFDYPLL